LREFVNVEGKNISSLFFRAFHIGGLFWQQNHW